MTTHLARCLTHTGTQQPSALSLSSPEAVGPASNFILAPGRASYGGGEGRSLLPALSQG